MKFHLSKEKLLEGLQQVQSVVSTRTTLPILSNVLLQTNGKGINMTTTDLDVGVRCNVDAEITEAGATTLPARRLFTIIRELPSSDVQFESDGKNVASIQSRARASSKSSGCRRRNSRRCRSSRARRCSRCARASSRTRSRKRATPSPPTRRATCSTASCVRSRMASSRSSPRTAAGWRWWTWTLEVPAGSEASVIIPAKAISELAAFAQGRGRHPAPPRRESGGV